MGAWETFLIILIYWMLRFFKITNMFLLLLLLLVLNGSIFGFITVIQELSKCVLRVLHPHLTTIPLPNPQQSRIPDGRVERASEVVVRFDTRVGTWERRYRGWYTRVHTHAPFCRGSRTLLSHAWGPDVRSTHPVGKSAPLSTYH